MQLVTEMSISRPFVRLGGALLAGAAATILVSGIVLAHPETEGDHPNNCVVTVEPDTVAAGQTFTVAGNFGSASIFIVGGTDASPAEDAVPDATTPAGSSFSVTFTAEASDVGSLTVWGVIEGSECGDSDALTMTATVPDTALEQPSDDGVLVGVIVFLATITVAADRLSGARR